MTSTYVRITETEIAGGRDHSYKTQESAMENHFTLKMDRRSTAIPPEIWLQILENLPLSDVVHRASLVCKRLLDISRAPVLCKSVTVLTHRLDDPAVAEAYSALFKRASLLEVLEVSNMDTDVSNLETEPMNNTIRRRGGRKRNVFGMPSISTNSKTEELIVEAIKNCPVRQLRIRCFCCPTDNNDRFSHDFFNAMERHAIRIQSLTLPRAITADERIRALPGLLSRLRDLEIEVPSGARGNGLGRQKLLKPRETSD